MQPISCNLGRLGSRLNLIFEPQNNRVRQSALGMFLDEPADLMIGVEDTTGTRHVFPFSTRGTPLRYVETRLTPTSVTWVGACVPLYVLVECTFTAPFWPQDEKTSLWPGYYISIAVRPMNRIRWHKQQPPPAEVKVVFDLQRKGRITPGPKTALEFTLPVSLVPSNQDTILADWPVKVQTDLVARTRDQIEPVTSGWQLRDGVLETTVAITRNQPNAAPLLMWTAHTDSVVLETGNQPARFRYVRHWPALEDAVSHGKKHAKKLLARAATFDTLIASSALSVPAQQLFSQSLQSYFMNTWWCDRIDGREWFSVWEGSCLFHSTVDVEYNVSPFYYLLWPHLLGLQLRQWTDHLKPNQRGPGRYLDHDMGAGSVVNGTEYGHIMGVEEAGNYLLMLNAHVRFNGDTKILREPAIRDAIRDMTDYLLWTDQRGRGFPTEDVANTVDDGCPALQFGREQVYLAVKRLAALRAAEALLPRIGKHPKTLRNIRQAVALTKRTLRKNAWLGDHYAVCIDADASTVIDPYTNKPFGKGKLEGWDDYHIYASNGLLLLLMTGTMPDRDLVAPMRRDIASALQAALGPYGCSHNAGDPMNVWISQNIWRDCVAHYLNEPIPDLTSRYWEMQVWSNTGDQAKCFVDTYLNNNLSRYPRGIACAGYLMSLAGLQLDRTRRLQKLAPVIQDGQIPLFPLADWKKEKIPVLVVQNGKGKLVDFAKLAKASEHLSAAKTKTARLRRASGPAG
jgi:hypothetical protein